MVGAMTTAEQNALNAICPGAAQAKLGTNLALALARVTMGNSRYVDSVNGDDGNYDGRSQFSALKTIQKAIDLSSDFDTIFIRGTFTEAATCAKKLSILGVGPTVQNAIWMESTAGQTLLTLTAAQCKVANIRFRIPTTGGIGINMLNSDYTIIQNCHFQGRSGSYYGIYNSGGSQCQILDNVFQYLNTATYGTAIMGYSTTTIPAGWIMSGNLFHSNLRHVYMTMRQSQILDNIFTAVGLDADNTSQLTATVKLDLTSQVAGGQLNTVTRNTMLGTYSISGGYKPATGDNWYGNKSSYVSQTGVTAEGTTTAVPA